MPYTDEDIISDEDTQNYYLIEKQTNRFSYTSSSTTNFSAINTALLEAIIKLPTYFTVITTAATKPRNTRVGT